MQLRFGRFQGYELADVEDEQYLVWLSRQSWLWPELREEIRRELQWRQHDREERNWEAWAAARRERRRVVAPPAPRVDLWGAEQIIKAGYRVCAASWHPDRGGTHEAMTRINAARDWLMGEVRALPMRVA
jgi:hypothetical protein